MQLHADDRLQSAALRATSFLGSRVSCKTFGRRWDTPVRARDPDPQFHLRLSRPEDRDFIHRVTREAYVDLVERQYGSWDDEAQRRRVEQKLLRVDFRIIQVEDRAVGIVATDVRHDHVRLDELAILPTHQSRGLGSAVLERELASARGLGKPVRLHTPQNNIRAIAFYRRHGFVEISRDEMFIDLERVWTPS